MILDKITIDTILVDEPNDLDEGNHKALEHVITINDEVINKTVDVYAFLMSGKNGSHEIFTCTCGIAGCAGIWDGVHVKHRGYTTEWRMKREDGYDFTEKKFYHFDSNQYHVERLKALEEVKVHFEASLKDHYWSGWVEQLVRAYNGIPWYAR
jgi:hypothetical protein